MIRRFAKFGIVGATGYVVNIVVLYVVKSIVFAGQTDYLYGIDLILNLALICAIVCSLTSNFLLNYYWTWAERRVSNPQRKRKAYLKYFVLSWLGIFIQVIFTNILVQFGIYYLIASVIAVGAASIANFVLNDKYTFRSNVKNV